MRLFFFLLGLFQILATLLDAFETILLPRRINRRFRYSRFYYQLAWRVWRRSASLIQQGRLRESVLSVFGPLSMLGLFGSWIMGLILGFAFMQMATASTVMTNDQVGPAGGFFTCLYFSGSTFFTLGLGDVAPAGGVARTLAVAEAGMGLGFLAIIISYLPVLYGAFSKREQTISLLDARAGSPPGAGEFLARLAAGRRLSDAAGILRQWEQWCAELLESHISFPVLAYYRSQHANQSWLAALATMLDASAMLLTLLPAEDAYQVQLTFAMARHAAVDIALIFAIRPSQGDTDRLPPQMLAHLLERLRQSGAPARDASDVQARFAELRAVYEPFLTGLAAHFLLNLPPMIGADGVADNWQRSAWMPKTPGIGRLSAGKTGGDHFD